MTLAILTLIGTLVPFIIWMVRRIADHSDGPLVKNRKRYEQIDEDIARRDSAVRSGDDLDECERLQKPRSGGISRPS